MAFDTPRVKAVESLLGFQIQATIDRSINELCLTFLVCECNSALEIKQSLS